MSSLLNNIQKALVIHDFPTIVKICINHFYNLFTIKKSRHVDQYPSNKIDLEFDKKWESDTGGIFRPDKSDVTGHNWIYGQKYQGCDPVELKEVISKLDIQYDKFTFIDLGSGKGRAVMVASSFPFKKIIGVEYSRHLNDIARINLSHIPDIEKQCKDIELIQSDAELFNIPVGPLIIFIYNSFGKQVMSKVVKNVISSINQDKRQIIVIYFKAEFADVWRNSDFMKEKRISNKNAIYATDYI